MKLLTPEGYERGLRSACQDTYGERQLLATIKAACERIAAMEECPKCTKGDVQLDPTDDRSWGPCPDCDGTGLAHKDAMGALRALGEG